MHNLIAITLILFTCTLSAQNQCNDPKAKNTGEAASCRYKKSRKIFKRITKLDDVVHETSGLIHWNGGIWTINDSGNEPVLYKLNTETGKVIQQIRIKNAKNKDWEELAQDDNHIYIGDFGNNKGSREGLRVLKIKKSDIDTSTFQSIRVKKIKFHYPEQTNFQKRDNHHFDCEGFFYHNNQLHLFTKNRDNGKTYHYTLPTQAGKYAAQIQDSLNVKGQITAADINENGVVVLLGYTPKKLFVWMCWDYEGDRFFSGNCRRIEIGRFFWRGQLEGICFTNGNSGYISGENIKIWKQHLRAFNLDKWLVNK
jgi:hypothetical protein